MKEITLDYIEFILIYNQELKEENAELLITLEWIKNKAHEYVIPGYENEWAVALDLIERNAQIAIDKAILTKAEKRDEEAKTLWINLALAQEGEANKTG